jgi:hypothetical protein
MLAIYGSPAAAADPPLSVTIDPIIGAHNVYLSSGMTYVGSLTANPVGGSGSYSYAWTSDDGNFVFDDASAQTVGVYCDATFPIPYSTTLRVQVTSGTQVADSNVPGSLNPDV